MWGPSFDYMRMPALVRRTGHGPLRVVWDTNVLSMYEQYGAAMWEGESPAVRGHDPAEVEALGVLVSTWMWWDIRFVVLDRTAADSKRPRAPEAVARREVAMRGLADALSLGLDGDGDEPAHAPRPEQLPDEVVGLLRRATTVRWSWRRTASAETCS